MRRSSRSGLAPAAATLLAPAIGLCLGAGAVLRLLRPDRRDPLCLRDLEGLVRPRLVVEVGEGHAGEPLPDRPLDAADLILFIRRNEGEGVAGGLGFGVVALAARTLTDLSPAALIRNPSLYLLIAGGLVGFLLYTTALQRGAVAVATTALVLGETVVPAAVGTLVLGDRARPGLAWLAVAGFVLAIAGAIALARFGDLERRPAGS